MSEETVDYEDLTSMRLDDEALDAIDDLLVDDSLKVVFNDGEATAKLSGYDLARWARHLASKIVGDAELLPPRPAGAVVVDVVLAHFCVLRRKPDFLRRQRLDEGVTLGNHDN